MTQVGRIVSVSGAKAVIEVRRRTACGHDCASCGGCATPNESIKVSAFNECGAEVGDTVTVESASGKILGLAALLYIMPLALMFFGYFAMPGSSGVKTAMAVAGLVTGVFICFLYSRRMGAKGGASFHIVSLCEMPEDYFPT